MPAFSMTLMFLRALFKDRAALAAENLALRQQPQRSRLVQCRDSPVVILILLRPAELSLLKTSSAL